MKRPPHRIQPKVSTMPRQRSEAAHYLDIYKLTIEKKRLCQELAAIDQRRERIQERLQTLEAQVESLAQGAQELRVGIEPAAPISRVYSPDAAQYGQSRSPQQRPSFDFLTLDY